MAEVMISILDAAPRFPVSLSWPLYSGPCSIGYGCHDLGGPGDYRRHAALEGPRGGRDRMTTEDLRRRRHE